VDSVWFKKGSKIIIVPKTINTGEIVAKVNFEVQKYYMKSKCIKFADIA